MGIPEVLARLGDAEACEMKRLLLLLPMLLLVACEPAEPTAAEVAEKLQVQINELLEEVDKSLEKVADLDLDGLCATAAGSPQGWICLFLDTEHLQS